LYPAATLSIDSVMTAAGYIIRSRKDSTSSTYGNAQIKDAGGTYQSLTIDYSTSTWRADAWARWGGRVKSAAHDTQFLNMPLPSGSNPIDILAKPGDAGYSSSLSLYAKSGLRIIDGEAYDKNGTWVDLTLGGNDPISISYDILYDSREGRWMDIVQVNVDRLRNNTVAMAKLNDPPAGGQAGILYVSTTSGYMTDPAVRLINGGTLPAAGLSVVTNRPLYIRGNFNTGNLPAAIFADAVTVLSGGWDDGHSDWSLSYRTASANTTVKAAIMTGNKNSVGSQYSGGMENLLRLLENWSGRTLTFSGSLACLWQSVQATGNWPGIGTVYNPPTRSWSYGISFANLPPGTPSVRSVQRTSWKQVLN